MEKDSLREVAEKLEGLLTKTVDTTDIANTVGTGNLLAAQDLDPVIKNLAYRKTPFYNAVRKAAGFGAGFNYNLLEAMASSTLDLSTGAYADGNLPTATDPDYGSQYAAYKQLGWKSGVTGLAQARGERVIDLLSNGVEVLTKKLIDTMEFMAFWGDTASSALQYDGLNKLITTNVVDAAGGVITKDLIDRAAVRIQVQGGYATHIFASPRVKADINNLYNQQNQVIINMPGADDLTAGQMVQRALTVAGNLPIVDDFFLNPGNTYTLPNGSSSTPLGATTSTVFILNMDYIEQKVLQAPMVEMLGKTTDTTEFFVKTYTALKVSAEPWMAKIINVKDNTLT